MLTRVDLEVSNDDLLVGLVEAGGLVVAESPPELRRAIEELALRRAAEDFPPPDLRAAVRKLLRRGGFDPSGRNKPASEYLAGRARAGAFPFHSNVVDIGNYVSLLSGLPISIVDVDLALADAPALVIRLGREGESYVFNPAGQEIRIDGLLSLARANGPAVGNPVKDSMASKVNGKTRRALAALYASRRAFPEPDLRRTLEEFARLLRFHASAAETDTAVLRG